MSSGIHVNLDCFRRVARTARNNLTIIVGKGRPMTVSVLPVRILLAAVLLALAACTTMNRPPLGGGGGAAPRFQAPGGRAIEAVTIGENFQIGATGLRPRAGYEFNLWLGDRRVGFSRVQADERGSINPLILWHQSGVVGCGGDIAVERARRGVAFRDFDEAEQALSGQRFRLELREANPRATTRETAMIASRSPALATLALPARRSAEPTVFPSNAEGCLLNSSEARTRDMHVSGRGFRPGERVELAVVANQTEWHVGDRIGDLADGRDRMEVRADANGRFTAMVWNRASQHRGAYDIIARRLDLGEIVPGRRFIRRQDVISSGLDTAYILFLYYPPGGSQMDIAGRPLIRSPYFAFADSFATASDDVWGGVDPTYVAQGHPGGTHAAYYVVAHRDATQWTGATNLADVSGLVEVTQVKAGCINGTYMAIWQGSHPVGAYDVVVNFGSVPANSTQTFVDDLNYDSAIDFLDGAIQIGFVVLPDPNALGPMQVGQTSYSVDDAFALSAQVSAHHGSFPNNVDLRAVVRYPATVAGVDTPVAAGAHPLFIMQHGNHGICNVGSNTDHDACPVGQRERNHEGYMRLLDVLASHGVIAVSVDAFDVTGIYDQWIPERADLNLKHLEFWSHLNNGSTYPANATFATQTNMAGRFTGHVDMARISVSGHSRGGEASVSTYVRNQARPLAQRFSITSVSSIAPVDGPDQYVLNDVPYFVILPAADGDVYDLSGARIYDRAGGAAAGNVTSGIDVYGASHNFFNTVWAGDGDDGDFPRPDYIPAADQQRIGESYIAAFTLSDLRGMSGYEDMLRGRLSFAPISGYRIYHFRHDVPFMRLDDGGAASPVASGLTASSLANPSVHQTLVKLLGWNGASPTYRYNFGPANLSNFEVLSFRVAQTNAAANTAPNLEFIVELRSGGNVRAVYSGLFAPIPSPYVRTWGTNQNVMTTVRVPLHSFIMNNSPVDLTGIDSVQFTFTVTNPGDIYVDDVEFSR
jgi:hypothetical protein